MEAAAPSAAGLTVQEEQQLAHLEYVNDPRNQRPGPLRGMLINADILMTLRAKKAAAASSSMAVEEEEKKEDSDDDIRVKRVDIEEAHDCQLSDNEWKAYKNAFAIASADLEREILTEKEKIAVERVYGQVQMETSDCLLRSEEIKIDGDHWYKVRRWGGSIVFIKNETGRVVELLEVEEKCEEKKKEKKEEETNDEEKEMTIVGKRIVIFLFLLFCYYFVIIILLLLCYYYFV